MNDSIPDAIDELIAPDEWAAVGPKAAPLDARAELARQTAEFLAQGGKIQEVPVHATGIIEGAYFMSFPVGARATPDPELKRKAEQARYGDVKKKLSRDDKAAEKLSGLLDAAATLAGLAADMGCSVDKVQRLIRDRFADDARADPFRKRTREESRALFEKDLLSRIAAAQQAGARGIWAIAHSCNANFNCVAQVNKKFKLGLVLGKGDNRAGRDQPKRVYNGKVICAECAAKITGSCHFCPHCGQITAKGLTKEQEEA